MPALALTDHQGLSGAIRFYQACKKAGIAPILGCEVVVETAGILGEEADLPPEKRLVLPASVGFGRASAVGFHLTLLVPRLRRLPQPVPAALAHAPARAARADAS